MKEITESLGGGPFAKANGGVEERVFRVMAAAVALAVITAALLGPWRVTAGLLLGGLLSLGNYHWLQSSVVALLNASASGQNANVTVSRYVLRYFVITALVVTAFMLNAVSLPATLVGLCSFVIALFVEAFREIYFTITHREGLN